MPEQEVLEPKLSLADRIALYRKLHPQQGIQATLSPHDADMVVKALRKADEVDATLKMARDQIEKIETRMLRRERVERVLERLQWLTLGIALTLAVHGVGTVAVRAILSLFTGVAP